MSSVTREFVSLVSATGARNGAGFNPCQGLYFQPADKIASTAFIATHYNVDFSEHYLGEYLALRGFGFFGWNTRFRGNVWYAKFTDDDELKFFDESTFWGRKLASWNIQPLFMLQGTGIKNQFAY